MRNHNIFIKEVNTVLKKTYNNPKACKINIKSVPETKIQSPYSPPLLLFHLSF